MQKCENWWREKGSPQGVILSLGDIHVVEDFQLVELGNYDTILGT